MTVEYVANERRALPVAEFMRERMGWWESSARGGLFHMPDWWKIQDGKSTPGPTLHMAVHVTPDRSWASVAVASRRGDGIVHVELIERRAGVSWVVPYIVERSEKHRAKSLVLAGGMAAGSLAPELEALPGFDPLNSTEVRRACANLYDLVREGTKIAHRSEKALATELATAVEAAARSSDKGEWIFSAAPEIDLSPLYAIALATWSASTGPRQLTDAELLASAY
jgi:hypothetical protein